MKEKHRRQDKPHNRQSQQGGKEIKGKVENLPHEDKLKQGEYKGGTQKTE